LDIKRRFEMKRLFSKVLMGFVLVSLVVSITSIDSRGQTQKAVMRIAIATSGVHPQNYLAERFKLALEKKVGDKVDVQIFPSAQLGGVGPVLQGVQNGSIESTICPLAFLGGIASASTVVELPGFLPGSQAAAALVNTPAGDPLRDYMRTKGIELMTTFGGGDRIILTRHAVTHLDQMKGKKVRIMGAKMQQMEISAIGAVPVAMDVPELLTAFQQGIIDGIETDVLFFYTGKYYELAKSLVFEPKAPIIMGAMASKVWTDKLPPEIRKAVTETAQEVTLKEVNAYVQKMIQDCTKAITSAGVTAYETPADLRKALIAKYDAIPEQFLKDNPTARPIYDALLAAAQKQKQ
jgi:C4-dicarboxylate-binding protein DctP